MHTRSPPLSMTSDAAREILSHKGGQRVEA